MNNEAESNAIVDQAARVTLAAIGLVAATLAREEGADLRSRCQLFPTQKFVWELLDIPGEDPKSFSLTGKESEELLRQAISEANKVKLPWLDNIYPQTYTGVDTTCRQKSGIGHESNTEGGE